MKKTASYKDLTVYQKSEDLTVDICKYFSNIKISNNYFFIHDQLLRSVSSIGANISEGYGRYYKKSYRQFLSIARGSSFEVDYWLTVSSRLAVITPDFMQKCIKENTEIHKMLTVMMKKLEERA